MLILFLQRYVGYELAIRRQKLIFLGIFLSKTHFLKNPLKSRKYNIMSGIGF